MTIRLEVGSEAIANIKVIGVGGGGSNAVSRMAASSMTGVEFIVVNTDVQALRHAPVEVKLQIGEKRPRVGRGADPEKAQGGHRGHRQDPQYLQGRHGLHHRRPGRHRGGAAPIISTLAKEMEILTVGVVTKPFVFEGKRRADQAGGVCRAQGQRGQRSSSRTSG
jgi:cell division protein FtsZ